MVLRPPLHSQAEIPASPLPRHPSCSRAYSGPQFPGRKGHHSDTKGPKEPLLPAGAWASATPETGPPSPQASYTPLLFRTATHESAWCHSGLGLNPSSPGYELCGLGQVASPFLSVSFLVEGVRRDNCLSSRRGGSRPVNGVRPLVKQTQLMTGQSYGGPAAPVEAVAWDTESALPKGN